MRRWSWLAVLAASCWAGLTAPCQSGVAHAESKALARSAEVERCLRVGKLPGPGSEDRQLQCLASQDESGFVELVRAIARRRHEKPGFGGERLEHMSWKVRGALSEGRQEAAVAVETMLDGTPTADVELETTALEAMRWIMIARRQADFPKGHKPGAARPLAMAPRACIERIDAEEPRVAQKAVACVAEAEAGIPAERLIAAVLKRPDRVDIWRVLKRLRKLPEGEARRLAEVLVAQHDDDGRADDLCEILLHTTPMEASWATLAGRRAFDQLGVRQCEALARRSSQREPAAAAPARRRKRCLDVPVPTNDYVTLCAADLGPGVSEPARRGELQAHPSRFSRYPGGQVSTSYAWLLEGERLLVDELSYVPLGAPPQGPRPERWDDGLVIVPSDSDAGGQRRLHVFGLRNRQLGPRWQSPECRQSGCRLDLVARRNIERDELLGLVLLTEQQAAPVAVGELVEGTLDERLGCSRLRPLSLGDCRGLVAR